MNIALKEAQKSHYWLRLIRDAEYPDSTETNKIIHEADEPKEILDPIVSKLRRP